MDAHELGEKIAESTEHHGHAEHGEQESGNETFRKRTAVFVGGMGMLLAIASLGGDWAMKETINYNISASDTYNFYQSRNIRQTSYQIASEELQTTLATNPNLPPEVRDGIAKRIKDYQGLVARYDSDPERHEGKKELLAKAKEAEHHRDTAQEKDLNFDFARAFYEIAIVLGSVSIVALSRPLLWLCGALALVALALTVNGFFPFFELPLGG